MIKALDETGVKIIHKLVNDIYKTGVIPTSMNESIFIPLPKKPKATMCTEYRTLSLMLELCPKSHLESHTIKEQTEDRK